MAKVIFRYSDAPPPVKESPPPPPRKPAVADNTAAEREASLERFKRPISTHITTSLLPQHHFPIRNGFHHPGDFHIFGSDADATYNTAIIHAGYRGKHIILCLSPNDNPSDNPVEEPLEDILIRRIIFNKESNGAAEHRWQLHYGLEMLSDKIFWNECSWVMKSIGPPIETAYRWGDTLHDVLFSDPIHMKFWTVNGEPGLEIVDPVSDPKLCEEVTLCCDALGVPADPRKRIRPIQNLPIYFPSQIQVIETYAVGATHAVCQVKLPTAYMYCHVERDPVKCEFQVQEHEKLRKIMEHEWRNPEWGPINTPKILGYVRDPMTLEIVGLLREWITTGGLNSYLANRLISKISLHTRMMWMKQITRMMKLFHEAGILWGSAVPENILIDRHGVPWTIYLGGDFKNQGLVNPSPSALMMEEKELSSLRVYFLGIEEDAEGSAVIIE